MEEAAASAAAESDARALEEVQQREARLEAMLAEAQASVANMRRLHQASQNQLFTMQASETPAMWLNAVSHPSDLELSCSDLRYMPDSVGDHNRNRLHWKTYRLQVHHGGAALMTHLC